VIAQCPKRVRTLPPSARRAWLVRPAHGSARCPFKGPQRHDRLAASPLLGAARRCSALLGTARHCSALLGTARHCAAGRMAPPRTVPPARNSRGGLSRRTYRWCTCAARTEETDSRGSESISPPSGGCHAVRDASPRGERQPVDPPSPHSQLLARVSL